MKPRKFILKSITAIVSLLLIFFFFSKITGQVKATAGINRTINFQGKLVTKTTGVNITDGDYSMTFKFYDAASGGTQLPSGAAWSETQTVTVTNGLFRVTLGASTAIPAALDFNSDALYLDITFNSETFGSRVRMTAVPYAFNAEKVSGLTVTNTTGTFTLTNAKTLSVSNTLTFAGTDSTTITFQGTDTYVGRTTTDTLTNKTLTSPTIGTSPTAAGATWTDLGTVTTADINGGTIDGAVIGGASAAAGTFTSITGTSATFNGNVDMTSDLILNIGDTGTDFTTGGGLTLAEAFIVNDDATFTLAAGEKVLIDGATTDSTGTAGVLDIDLDTTSSQAGIDIDAETITDSAADTVSGIKITGTQTSTDDDVIYGLHVANLAGTADAGAEYAIYQAGTAWDYGLYVEDAAYFNTTVNVVGALTSATLDTGQGANELYDMDQNVLTTSAVTFATLDTGQGANELYDMDQNVLTTSAPTFAGATFNGNVDMTSDLILNIGDTGTDFTTGGGLTLAELLTVNDDVDFVFAAGENLNLDATTTDSTTTGGVIDLNVDAGNAVVLGLNIDFAQSDGATAATDAVAQKIVLTGNDADGDVFGLHIESAATTNAAAGTYETLLKLVNAENTASAVTDAILIDSTSATDADIVDAIDASDANITNAINIGANAIAGTNFSVTGAGAITSVGLTSSGAIAANAGITFDASTDTVGAFTLAGTLDASTQLIINIGNAGTDFDSSGGLTLASTLTLSNNTITCTGCVDTTDILNDTILEIDLKAVDAAADEECLTYETTTGDFEWQSCGGGSSPWQTTSNVANLVTATDDVNIGGTASLGKLGIDGDTDEIQLLVQGHSTQTSTKLVTFENSAGTDLFTVDGLGAIGIASTATTADTFNITNTSVTTGEVFEITATKNPSGSDDITRLNLTSTNDSAGTVNALKLNFTSNPSAAQTERVLSVQNQATTNTTDTSLTALLWLDNADTSATGSTVVDSALLIENSGNIAAGITNAININDTDITTDLLLQNDETIDNDTDGTVNIGTTTLKLTGGTTIISDQTTVALLNTTTTTLNLAGAASTLNIGADSSTTNLKSATFVLGPSGTLASSTIKNVAGSGDDITGKNLTIEPGNGTGSGGSGAIIFRTAPADAGSYDTITVDAASSSTFNGDASTTSFCYSHTTGSGSNRILVVGASFRVAPAGLTVSSVTYGSGSCGSVSGQSLTKTDGAAANMTVENASSARAEFWKIVAPTSGANTIQVTFSAAPNTAATGHNIVVGATSWTGVHQTTPLGTFASATGSSTAPSVAVTSSASPAEVVVDVLARRNTTTDTTAAVDTGQTSRWNPTSTTTGNAQGRGAGSSEAGAASVTMSWTLSGTGQDWAIGGVPLKPALAPASTANTLAEAMRISNTGKVGIGDSTPTEAQLVLSSDLYIGSFASSGTAALCWDGSGGSLVNDCSGTPVADYAEIYPTEQDVDYAEVVAIGPNSAEVDFVETDEDGNPLPAQKRSMRKLTKSTTPYQNTLLGVVSKNWSDFSSVGHNSVKDEDHPLPVALSGRVPVKVSSENGAILAGDALTSSSIPGVAMKATQSGRVIGTAIEDYNAEGVGTVLTFINPGYYEPDMYLADSGDFEIKEKSLEELETDQGGADLTYLVNAKTGEKVEKIGAFSEIVTNKISGGEISFNVIRPLERDLTIDLREDGKIVVKGQNEEVINFDNQGNAYFAGTLTAKKIKADEIEGLAIYTDKLSSLAQKLENETNALDQKTATESGVVLGESTETEGDKSSIAQLLIQDGLTVEGNATFKGDTLFEKFVVFVSNVIFKGDVEFEKSPLFAKDTAGFAQIKRGERFVEIVFEKEYQVDPVVNITLNTPKLTQEEFDAKVISGDCVLPISKEQCESQLTDIVVSEDLKYFVAAKTKTGFVILLNKFAPTDITFSWSALAVKDVKTFSGSDSLLNLTQPTVTPTPTEVPLQSQDIEGQPESTESAGLGL